MLDEVFGTDYEYDCITIIHNPRGIQGKNFSYTNEFAYFVIPKGDKIIGERHLSDDEVYWSPLRNWGSESLRTDARNCFYPIIVKDDKIIKFGDISPNDFHPQKNELLADGSIAVYPIDAKGIERKWRYARQSVEGIFNFLKVKKVRGVYDIELGKTFATYKKDIADIADLRDFCSADALSRVVDGFKGFAAAFSAKSTPSDRLISAITAKDSFQELLKYEEVILVAVNL